MNKFNLLIMKIRMFITSYFPLYIILLLLQISKYPVNLHKDEIYVPATVLAIVLVGFMIISI